MIITTTQFIEGKQILEYKGIVVGKKLAHNEMFGPSVSDNIISAYESAIKEMEQKAIIAGANAIIGVNIVNETYGQNTSKLIVAYGTAVLYG